MHLFQHTHGERGPACPERSRLNCPGRLMFHMRNLTFTGVLVLVVAENEKFGSNTKPRYNKDEFKRKNTGTVCRVTHNDGIKNDSPYLV